jgi:hypothetical protein
MVTLTNAIEHTKMLVSPITPTSSRAAFPPSIPATTGNQDVWLAPAENKVDRVAAADVGAGAAEMPKDFLIVATLILKGISQDCKAHGVQFAGRQVTLFLCGSGKVGNDWGEPVGIDGNGAKGIAENLAKDVGNCPRNLGLRLRILVINLVRHHTQLQRLSGFNRSGTIFCGVAGTPGEGLFWVLSQAEIGRMSNCLPHIAVEVASPPVVQQSPDTPYDLCNFTLFADLGKAGPNVGSNLKANSIDDVFDLWVVRTPLSGFNRTYDTGIKE